MPYVIFRESHAHRGWVKGTRYPCVLVKKSPPRSGIKGYVRVESKEGPETYYYPDDSFFIVVFEELKGLEKEIDDLSLMGYRNG